MGPLEVVGLVTLPRIPEKDHVKGDKKGRLALSLLVAWM